MKRKVKEEISYNTVYTVHLEEKAPIYITGPYIYHGALCILRGPMYIT